MGNKPRIRFKGFTEDWEQRKLSELATMNARIGWQNLRTSEFLDSGDYLLITGTDFDNGRVKYSTCHYVEKKRFDQDTKIQISTGSILITKDGTLGKVALVEELPKPATLNAGVFNVRVKDDAVLSYKYLYHYLKASFLMKYVTANATGGTIKHLNQSILVDFPIPITEKPEQDRIAKLLDSLESSITLHQCKLEKLKLTKKALLQKLFPKNGKHIPEIRFKGFTDTWEQRKLSEIVTINPKTELPDEFKYVDLESVVGTNLLGFQVIKKENAPSRAQRLASYGDVFYQTVRPYQRNNYLFENVDKDMVFSTGYAQLRSKLDSYFLLTLVQNNNFVKVVLDNCTGTSYPAINGSELGKIIVQIPSNEVEANQIGKVFRGIDKSITLHQRKLERLQEVKKGLLQKMFV